MKSKSLSVAHNKVTRAQTSASTCMSAWAWVCMCCFCFPHTTIKRTSRGESESILLAPTFIRDCQGRRRTQNRLDELAIRFWTASSKNKQKTMKNYNNLEKLLRSYWNSRCFLGRSLFWLVGHNSAPSSRVSRKFARFLFLPASQTFLNLPGSPKATGKPIFKRPKCLEPSKI